MSPPRLLVAAAIALALVVGLLYFAKALSKLNGTATANSELSFADREVGGGNSIVVDQDAAYEARALIPPRSTYRVVTGSLLRNATPLTMAYIAGWFTYFLMPRRPAPSAKWVICYGCDTSSLGAPFTPRWHDDNGISIGVAG